MFKSPTSTLVSCDVDYDNIFLFALLRAQNIVVLGSNIAFFDGKGAQILKAINIEQSKVDDGTYDPSSPVIKVVKFIIPKGNYKFSILRTNLKVLPLTVDGETISFRGCNTWNFNYKGTTDGLITFSGGSSTRIFCPADNDTFYADAIKSIVKYSEMKGMYTFFDKNGKSVLSFVSDFGGSSSGSTNTYVDPVLPVVLPTPQKPTVPVQRTEFK